MKDVNKVYEVCSKRLTDIGINHGNIDSVIVNTRAKRRWGRCIKYGRKYKIEISHMLLNDEVPDYATENTMIHELLHSCDGCYNHGTKWKRLANRVNMAYGYNIKRTTSASEKGIEYDESCRKHKIVCQKCGNISYRIRNSKLVQHPEYFRCICGGDLVKEY